MSFEEDVDKALEVLRNGGTILYPTDTIWGLGCDACNADAVRNIYNIKQRPDSKSLIILVADERAILQYVAAPDPVIFDFIAGQTRPTTVIFEGAINLPDELVAEDGSIAIRITTDKFCRHLIRRLRHPLVSTSANVSGSPSPGWFGEVSDEIRSRVDYCVEHRQNDLSSTAPSQIVKLRAGRIEVIRK